MPRYHALTQGHLIGEVVRRVTGTTIGQYFKTEVADVLAPTSSLVYPKARSLAWHW